MGEWTKKKRGNIMSTLLDIALLIGNGFDLSAGLHTEVTGFISELVKQHLGNDTAAGRLANHIDKMGIETWAEFEIKFGEYAEAVFTNGSINDPVTEYLDAKVALERTMKQMISQEDKRVTDSFIEENREGCLESISYWYNKLARNHRRQIISQFTPAPDYIFRYSVITFNYTSLSVKIFGKSKGEQLPRNLPAEHLGYSRISDFFPVHGTLLDYPVCGVDGTDQICCPSLSENYDVQRSVIKPIINEYIAQGIDADAMNAIHQSEGIVVFGMSIGASDRRWWKMVLDQLVKSKSKFLVICSHDLASNIETIPERLRKTDSIKRQLFYAAGYEEFDPSDDVADRIFIIPSSNVLMFQSPLIGEEEQSTK